MFLWRLGLERSFELSNCDVSFRLFLMEILQQRKCTTHLALFLAHESHCKENIATLSSFLPSLVYQAHGKVRKMKLMHHWKSDFTHLCFSLKRMPRRNKYWPCSNFTLQEMKQDNQNFCYIWFYNEFFIYVNGLWCSASKLLYGSLSFSSPSLFSTPL